jgi:chromosome segregation protein
MVRASAGYEAALAAALGPAADAVVYEDGSAALRDAADGGGATLAIAGGAAAAAVLEGERPLLSVVTADGPARGIVGVLLADVYLADDLQAAVRGAASSRTSFVTRDGMLVGPVTIRTASDRAARATVLERDVRDAEHDVAGTTGALQPLRHRLEAVDAELAATVARIDEADRSLTALADRVGLLDGHVEGLEREETLLAERIAGMDEAAAAWRDRLETAPNDAGDVPALPPVPEAPVAAKVAVEAFRQERTTVQGRLAEIDREVAALGRQDPAALSGDLQAAEERRAAAEEALRGAASTATEAAAARTRAATAQTEAVDAEATLNKEWRDASSGLEQLRESYEDQDRARADLERRIRDAERMIREGYGREPDEVLADLADDETIATLERKAELVQRRLGLLGRVNLLAGGELEALQERHDFLDRELDDVKKARRDLLEVIRRIEEEIVETFSSAYRDVAAEFERLFASLFPGGEGRLVATEPTDLLTTGIEIEARPPGKRMKRLSLLSGGEKALTSIAFLFAIFRSRPSPFYLMDEVEPALDDVNLHRFIKLIDGFAKDAQVLIVTHQKRTMEIANMLYGVSMSRDGTTKVVCQKVDAPGSTAPDDASGLVPEAGPVA